MLTNRCANKITLADLRFLYGLLSTFLFLSFTPFSWAQPESRIDDKTANFSIEELLQRFIHNGSRQLFEGTYVYLHDDQVQTIKVRRTVNDDGQVLEEFIPQDDEQDNDSRILSNQFCLLDNGWKYQFHAISSSFPFTVNNTFQELQKSYNFSISDSKTVAGINAIGVLIEAKDPHRYGYHLWFEPETATLLKYQLVNKEGKAIEQYLFTDISLHHKGKPQLSINSHPHQKTLKPPVTCKQRFAGLSEAFQQFFNEERIPEGYQVISYRQGLINDTKLHARQFQLNDGLSSVSVFIEDRGDVNKKVKGVMKIGPISVAGKTFGNHQITVIGAIPVDSALQFVNSIKKPAMP